MQLKSENGTTSRQRQWQERQKSKGLCSMCSEKAVRWGMCQSHVDKATVRRRKYRKVSKQQIDKSVWLKVDWRKSVEVLAKQLGVSHSTVRYHRPDEGRTCV